MKKFAHMIDEIQNMSLKIDELIKVLTPPNLFSDLAFWNLIVLTITLGFLVWYTIATHLMANQTKESNLRPVILRSAFVENWDKIKFKFQNNSLTEGTPLEFTILKNIATSINGYIIKDGLKFELLFGSEISKVGEEKNEIALSFNPNWGWMKADKKVLAIFKEENGKKTNKPNQIVINYKDIEGNKYFTVEDKNFDQKCFKGKSK
ncbi:hypothetical protein GF340_05020 [Candidatus Peregrinibacteria bacterium]|nr:hypothetical protein [Candidatus Peregrinibacteria bacterium]